MTIGVPHLSNLCFPNPGPAGHNPASTLRDTLSRTNTFLLSLQTQKHQTAAASGSGGFPRGAWEQPIYSRCHSHSRILIVSPCCVWRRRCGCLHSARCPWPCRCCISCPGQEHGGQASQSPRPGRKERFSVTVMGSTTHGRGEKRSGQVYLWIMFADVKTLLTEVEELREKEKSTPSLQALSITFYSWLTARNTCFSTYDWSVISLYSYNGFMKLIGVCIMKQLVCRPPY